MYSKVIIALLLISTVAVAQKQQIDIQRVEPPFWWVGMKGQELQLLVYGKNISTAQATLQYPGVEILRSEKTENPNYQFIYLHVNASAKAGIIPITFLSGKQKKIINYELKPRVKPAEEFEGFTPADVIYLVMPDRFAKGDETNDSMPGMYQQVNRKEPFGRHGGDLKGIEDHLDYIQDLGVTALWLNPALENNQQEESYHGYAITDFYKIDPRLGTNESYLRLTKKCREKNLKVIMDMVFNHSGKEHWFFKDPPTKDWYHSFDEYGTTNYRVAVPMDINASQYDLKKMEKGWFVTQMPDFNQSNIHLARYLTQNSIWWIEYAQLGGIRMDTYGYNDINFMEGWCKEILNEYPNFNIVGEVWEERIFTTSFYRPKSGYYGALRSVTDFALMGALTKAFNEEDGWEVGLPRIYYILAQDMLYKDPTYNLIFLDNHDMSRFATSVGGDVNKQKMGFATLLTMRGIPQIFYGMELGMHGDGNNHGTLRADMPGGWKDDTTTVFTEAGRTPQQKEIFDYLRTLLNWRKSKSVIHSGKFMHFIPENGIYVYFRYTDSESVMVILNNKEEPNTLDTKRFQERLNGYSSGKNVVTNETLSNLQHISLAGKSATIIELKR